MNNFDEYKKIGEPKKREKIENWRIAIGLQQVDGLKPSKYLIKMAKANIDGDLTIDEVIDKLQSYYKEKKKNRRDEERIKEADEVSARITQILAEKTFSFSSSEYMNIHKRLFSGIYKCAGKVRSYNITKEEWVLCGKSVYYASATNLHETLEYDLKQERLFKFNELSQLQIIKHIAFFVSNLWQIHIFGEGNTRTTAVFLIKYLRILGFTNVNNDLFEKHSWYFRNSLVRANYEDLRHGINRTDEYLIKFFENLLFNKKHVLKNRNLRIDTVNDTVFNLIKSNPKITVLQMKSKINMSIATIKRKIKLLKDRKYIERIGSDKKGEWKILK